jgi:hypothetical protein
MTRANQWSPLANPPPMQQNRPLPMHTKAQSWHTQCELVTFLGTSVVKSDGLAAEVACAARKSRVGPIPLKNSLRVFGGKIVAL